MATCPKCYGALTDNHRCPHGRLRRLSDSLVAVSIGAVVGVMLCFGLSDQPTPALIVASAALGAVIVNAVKQAIAPRF
jgi:hypothetical protein